jgi:hypothetical protein
MAISEIDVNLIKLKHSFGMIVAGPAQSGKTEFVRRLIQYRYEVCFPPPERIIWMYGQFQSRYNDPIGDVNIEYVEGFDSSVIENRITNKATWLIIDDLMSEISSDKRVTSIFTKKVHHLNMSCIFLVQNIFYHGKEMRTISLNCQYLCLFQNNRDKSQITNLAKQLSPGNVKFVQEAYDDATSKKYGYLLVDLHPETPNAFRFRTNVIPGDGLTVIYKRK